VGRSFAQRITAALAAVSALALLITAPAWATPRYASPSGSGSACTSVSKCSIVTAVNSASSGDEVILDGGDYYQSGTTPISTQITANPGIDVHPAAGQTRPRVFSSATNAVSINSGSFLRDIEIVHSGGNGALFTYGTVERVIVRSTGNYACSPLGGATMRDTVCVNTGLGATTRGVLAACSGCVGPSIFRNVTAYSENGYGLEVSVGDATQLTVNATNLIAHGGARDVYASTSGTVGTMSATVNLDHSNYATTQEAVGSGGGTASITPANTGTNQSAAPVFVNTFTGDFHQAGSSPTINAGITDTANGATDVDGEARSQGGATDIGADELPQAAPCACPLIVPRTPDKTKPAMSGFDVEPYAFAPLHRGPSVVTAKRRLRGATVIYSLSEAATVTFKVNKLRHRRCSRKRSPTRRCSYYKRLKGSFTHAGSGGANSFRFSGRLRRKTLKRGRYQLVGRPKDPAGNTGKSARTSFRIVRR
jgi:hypothetical protein